jgi:uncharacterized protein (DUF934 family)
MPLIRKPIWSVENQSEVDLYWKFIADDAELITGNITVSWQRWQQQKNQLLQRKGQIGVRLNFNDELNLSAEELKNIPLIELNFSFFGDGRLFSKAKLLRTRFNYSGEIRAVGNYLVDQVFYLSKVGVNAFQFEDANKLPLALAALKDFSVSYQT